MALRTSNLITPHLTGEGRGLTCFSISRQPPRSIDFSISLSLSTPDHVSTNSTYNDLSYLPPDYPFGYSLFLLPYSSHCYFLCFSFYISLPIFFTILIERLTNKLFLQWSRLLLVYVFTTTLYMQYYSAILQYTENTSFNVISTLCMQCCSAILIYTENTILTLLLHCICSAIAQYWYTLKTYFNVIITMKTRILTLLLHCILSRMRITSWIV